MQADRYVLDTSAILALTGGEQGDELVTRLLSRAASRKIKIFISFASFTECFYIRWQAAGEEEALKLVLHLGLLPIERVESDEETSLLAGELKANHALSFADAWVAALAISRGARLVHKDPEFEQLSNRLTFVRLPYK